MAVRVHLDARQVTRDIRALVDEKAMAVTKNDNAYEDVLWALSRHMVDNLPFQTGALALGRAVQRVCPEPGEFTVTKKNGKTYGPYKRTVYPRTGQITYHSRDLWYDPYEERPSEDVHYAGPLENRTGEISQAKEEAQSSQAFLDEAGSILARYMNES